MSESVKIPVSYGINNHTYAEVTADLARQIYLRGKCEVERIRLEAEKKPEPSLGAAHQADLEKAHAGDDAGISQPDLAINLRIASRFPDAPTACKVQDFVNAEIAALRARVEAAERRADEMEGKAGEWIAADVHKQRVQAAVGPLSVAVKALTAERDRALARVAELEADKSQALSCVSAEHGHNEMLMARVAELEKALAETSYAEAETLRKENIDARADLAAERERTQYWMHEALGRDSSGDERDAAVRGLVKERDRALADLKRSEKEAGTLCAKVVNLSADLAAERDSLSRMQGAYESLERERSGLSARLIDLQGKYESQVGMGADMEITRLRADLAAERERRDKAEAEAIRILALRADNGSQLDSLRADVERLKARKVKLPAISSPDSLFSSDERAAWDNAIDACTAAIRAAGVEVDCE